LEYSNRQRLPTIETSSEEPSEDLEKAIEDGQTFLKYISSLELEKEKFDSQQQLYEKYCDHFEEKKRTEAKIAKSERMMLAYQQLKQMILKTEVEVLEQRTRDIVCLVNTYLEDIFLEPIHVDLKMTRKTKTLGDRIQINLDIFYKNVKFEFGDLSGGEKVRLNLAFTLAFGHCFQIPLLLLDECTDQLDQELKERVLMLLNHAGIPQVLVIAHQIVEGSFDAVLKL
jgi:DNA repair exonuclease SbcCD ATPase subunit